MSDRPLSERQQSVLVAMLLHVRRVCDSNDRTTGDKVSMSAIKIADLADVRGVRRHGNGAVKGSWSGTTSPALSVASTLTSLVKRGMLERFDAYRHGYAKSEYLLTDAGQAAAHRLIEMEN